MTPAELAAIRARIEAATGAICGAVSRQVGGPSSYCVLPYQHDGPCDSDPRVNQIRPADALALLAEVDRLQRRIDDAEAGLLADAIFAAEHE